jgi:3-dehydroquinate synthase
VRVDGESPYDVVIGRSVLDELAPLLGGDTTRVAIVHPHSLPAPGHAVESALRGAGVRTCLMAVPDGENAKTVAVAADLWGRLGRAGFTRADVVVGVGGGATTDLAGFVAATYLRGVRVVHVPTTLLGMVDAAVGGKTAINTGEGKNLVGSFHEPAGVICDLGWLDSLPRADVVAGLAEVVKCGFVADPVILDLVAGAPDAATEPRADALRELIERAVAVKARVVASDLRESTSTTADVGREALNYGHTLGHAVERVEEYRIRHGEAVSIGMVFVAELSRLAGRLDDGTAALHREILQQLGLPTSYPPGRWPRLREVMRVDKKSRGDRLRFVVLERLARPAILEAPAEDLLLAAYLAVEG